MHLPPFNWCASTEALELYYSLLQCFAKGNWHCLSHFSLQFVSFKGGAISSYPFFPRMISLCLIPPQFCHICCLWVYIPAPTMKGRTSEWVAGGQVSGDPTRLSTHLLSSLERVSKWLCPLCIVKGKSGTPSQLTRNRAHSCLLLYHFCSKRGGAFPACIAPFKAEAAQRKEAVHQAPGKLRVARGSGAGSNSPFVSDMEPWQPHPFLQQCQKRIWVLSGVAGCSGQQT